MSYRRDSPSGSGSMGVPRRSRRRLHSSRSNPGSNTDLNVSMNLPSFVEETLGDLKVNWEFLIHDEFNPVPIALSLFEHMDQQEIQAFDMMLQRIQQAIDYASQDFYQEFNDSIGTYSQVTEDLRGSREVISRMQEDLRTSKQLLQSKQSDLLALHQKATQHKEMLNLLNIIEDLRDAPTKLEAHMTSRHWLTMVKELIKARELAHRADLQKIRGVDHIRKELDALNAVALEGIVEELHNHIYLKSPYTTELWTRAQVNLEENLADSLNSHRERLLEERVREETEQNPEADPHHYIRVLIEALDHLEGTFEAMETIKRRAAIEVSQLFSRTINEFTSRAAPGDKPSLKSFSGSAMAVLGMRDAAKWLELERLREFFSGLTARLNATLGLHLFTLRAADQKLKHSRTDSPYTLVDIWKCIQLEIKNFLIEHVEDYADPTDVFKRRNFGLGSSIGKGQTQNVFKLSLTSGSVPQEVKDYYHSVNVYTMCKPARGELLNTDKTVEGENLERLKRAAEVAAGGSGQRKTVVEPDADNVSVLFKPTLDLVLRFEEMNREKDDEETSHFRVFLDDFVLNVFIPKVEERIMNHVAKYLSGPDGFVLETDGRLLKSATALTQLTRALVGTLKNVPFHRKQYARMIETIMSKYLDRCQNKYMSIIKTQNDQSMSAGFAKNADFVRINLSLLEIPEDKYELRTKLLEEEYTLQREFFRKETLNKSALVLDRRSLVLLGILRRSLQWFGVTTASFKTVGPPSSSSNASSKSSNIGVSTESELNARLGVSRGDLNFSVDGTGENQLTGSRLELNGQSLPLSSEMASKFDELVQGFYNLADLCLYTLRGELHCHVYYYVELAIREGNYSVDNEATEPDPYVSQLNDSLQVFAEAGDALEPHEARFLFDGLADLVNSLFVSFAIYLRSMNRYGCLKMMRNVSSVQQTLSNIPFWRTAVPPLLTKAQHYYGLFLKGADLAVLEGPKLGFRKDEVLRLVELGTQMEDSPTTPYRRRNDSRNAPLKRGTYLDSLRTKLENQYRRHAPQVEVGGGD